MKKMLFILMLFFVFCGCFIAGTFYKHIAYKIYRLNHKPVISVVLSTYNRDYGLPISVESILNQTYKDFEFIIINDGSTDKTDAVLKAYAKKDPRIIYLKNDKNMGLIYSLNRGLKVAQGTYVARMDDDDYSIPDRFARQIQIMEQHPELAVLGSNIGGATSKFQVDFDKEPSLIPPEEVEINTYFSSGLAHPTIMIRREFLTKNDIWYPNEYLYAEDCGLYKRILDKGGKLSMVREPLLLFRVVKSKPGTKVGYGSTQSDSFKKLQQEKLMPLIGEVEPEKLGAFAGMDNRCILMKRMAKANKDKKIVNQKALENKIFNECPDNSGKRWRTAHPYWNDILIRNGKKIARANASDTGVITKEEGDLITIKWGLYPAEIFKKDEKKKRLNYLKDESGKIKSWNDVVPQKK